LTDTMSPAERSVRMALVRGKDTKPELYVRRVLHAAGLRYRLHDKRLPGRPDIVFPSRRIAVEVRGCLWHQHPDPDCKLARMPKSRLDFWRPKLEGNALRDRRRENELAALGWRLIVVWECQVADVARIQRIADEISTATAGSPQTPKNRGKPPKNSRKNSLDAISNPD
jgi:DNA mismatch endonuclease, patch repair protein